MNLLILSALEAILPYVQIFCISVALLAILITIFTFPHKNKKSVDADMPDDYDEQININAVHEAGHAVMAYLQDTKDFKALVSYSSAKTIVTYKSSNAENIKKMILVKYSGAIAEKLLLGEFQAGCMLSSTADFPSATELIKAYIIMTNPTVSKTLLNEELVDLIISASNSFYKEATEILSKNKEMLVVISDELKNKDSLKKNEIIQLLTNTNKEKYK